MKFLIVPCLFFIIVACNPDTPITYEQGLSHCDSLSKQRQEEIKTTFYSVGCDCINGASFPEFTASTMEGKVIDKEYFKGKVSVVNFWFITCPPCVEEIPVLNKVAAEFSNEPVNFLAIGRDWAEDITEFLEDHPWNFDHLAGRSLIEEKIKMMWGYPMTFVLDKNATIVACFHGFTESIAQSDLVPVIKKELRSS